MTGRLLLTCFLVAIMFFGAVVTAFADGFSGYADLNYASTKLTEETGETTIDAFRQNYYLTLTRQITPKLDYALYLRTSLTHASTTDIYGNRDDSYDRSAEPNLDIYLRNPVYTVNAGYRRTERWTTAGLSDEGRNTTEYYYSSFSLNPLDLPYLTLQTDRQKDYDYVSPKTSDTTTTTYSANSGYQLKHKGYKLDYSVFYKHSETETPLSLTSETTDDNFSGSYSLGYSGSFLNNRMSIALDYRANFGLNKTMVFSEQTQEVLLKRTASQGLHKQGSLSDTYNFALSGRQELVNADFNTGIADINILASQYHNIGIQVLSDSSVDRLYIYVNRDVSSDANLTNPSNWQVYSSNFNATGTWSLVTISNVVVSAYDSLNNIYRYEILFTSPQNASYFKAVNQVTAGVIGPSDVLVTEIEAYGTDLLQQGETETESTFFSQGLSLSGSYRASAALSFAMSYFINRSDSEPESILSSTGGIFKNIISKSFEDKEEMQSNVTRSYNLGAIWLAHRLLTVNARVGRSELFDNREETDLSTNSYNLSFSSSPLPALSANLSLSRNESYNFGEKQSTSHSVILTADSQLYRDVTMVTDIGYSNQESFSSDAGSDSSSYFVSGSLSAILTKKLSWNIDYDFIWSSSEEDSSDSQAGLFQVTYRPGRFINLSGILDVEKIDGDLSYTGSFSVDWLPLPVLRLNLNYQHAWGERESETSDFFSSYVLWKITKFMDSQITYSLAEISNEEDSKSHTITAKLNCRF
jgi:hypothetical protein